MEGRKGGRPASLYDNLDGSPGSSSGDERPRQVALLMSTTVPQNMAKPDIGGRHIPTRSSLRHSRMIVLSKQGKVPRKYLPHVLRSHKLAKCLLALKLLMGIAICTIAGWLLVWAPHLSLSDVHYWSGLPALLSSVVGLILVCSCRKEYPGMPMASYVFFFKVVSVLISTAAAVACFSASCLAGLHLARLYTASCQPEHVLNAPCVCETDTALDPPHIFTYPDLNCPEVWNVLSVLLIATCCANGLAGFLASWYIYLHWASRYSYIYSQIRTSDNRPIVITNKT